MLQVVPGDNSVLVAGCGSNRTVELLVDWETGKVSTTDLFIPVSLAVTETHIVIASQVCCEVG